MSNIHSELTDVQLHNPKGFAGASNNTVLIKNSSGNLLWDNIQPGMTCGIYSNYDYARWSHVGKTFSNAALLGGDVNLNKCSGALGTRLELTIVISSPNGNTGSDPSLWVSAEGDNGQDIITNATLEADGRLASSSPAFTTIGAPGIRNFVHKHTMVFDVITTPMTKITVTVGCVPTKTLDEGESYIMIKELCFNNTVQDLG